MKREEAWNGLYSFGGGGSGGGGGAGGGGGGGGGGGSGGGGGGKTKQYTRTYNTSVQNVSPWL